MRYVSVVHELGGGTPEQQRQTRREWMRNTFIAAVVNSDRTEIPLTELTFHQRGVIEHHASADGDWYEPAGSTGTDPTFVPDARHYYVTESEDVVLLRRASGRVRSRRELAEYRAMRERQRVEQVTAAKQRRAQMIAAIKAKR